MNASELLKLIPKGAFSALALETEVDYQVKKLSGEVVFKLILFSMLNSEKLSLRVMESFLSSAPFKSFAQSEGLHSKYRAPSVTASAPSGRNTLKSCFKRYSPPITKRCRKKKPLPA